MKLRGRVAVVTGAAGGIGRGIALALAGRGCDLALVDIDGAGLAATAAQAETAGVRTSRDVVDVADRAAVAALPAALRAAHGRVDLLVNNAGVALGGTFEQVSETDFDWLMAINFEAVVRMTRACASSTSRASTASSRRPARARTRRASSRCAASRTRCATSSSARASA